MTSIMFRPVAKKEIGELGAMLKEVCSVTALSNVRLAENCKEKEFYIADIADGADMQAVVKSLRNIKGLVHIKTGVDRGELEGYVEKYTAMSDMTQIKEMILADPHCTIGFMHGMGTNYRAGEVKALFNHAAMPQPKDLALAPDDAVYKITKAQKASLIYKTSRNAGDGIVRSANYWLRARF